MAARDPFRLPRGWTEAVRASVLHAVSVAFVALTRAWGSGATRKGAMSPPTAELDRAQTENALLREELAI